VEVKSKTWRVRVRGEVEADDGSAEGKCKTWRVRVRGGVEADDGSVDGISKTRAAGIRRADAPRRVPTGCETSHE